LVDIQVLIFIHTRSRFKCAGQHEIFVDDGGGGQNGTTRERFV